MHTPDMSDEELDALFQRGAESYPDEHNLSAWLDMERKLDAAAMQRQVRGKVLRIFALETVIILLGLLAWLGFARWSVQPETASAPTTAATPATAAPAQAPATSSAALPATSAATTHIAGRAQAPRAATSTSAPAAAGEALAAKAEPAAPKAAVTSSQRLASRPRISALTVAMAPARRHRPARAGTSGSVEATASAGQPLPASSRRSRLARATSGGAMAIVPAPAKRPAFHSAASVSTSEPAAATSTSSSASTSGVAALRPAPTLPASAEAQPSTAQPMPTAVISPADSLSKTSAAVAAAPALPTPPADSVKKKPAPKPVPAPARLSVALLLAPELSTVRWAGYTTPGSNVGVMLEYRLAPKWRLSAGALRSVKRYEARGTDYHPPTDYWTNYYTIDEVDATCHITDIPVNLRYDVLQRAQTSLFASVGLSSLLMRQEDYRYYYLYKGTAVERNWGLSKGSNHFLSVLNLSAGYEHLLGSRWAVQGEPFVKIPLGGVGFGKVKLSSAGVFFSLKYALLPAAR